MPDLSRETVQKGASVVSALLLVLVYGYLAGRYEWFPHDVLDRPVDQAQREVEDLTEAPDFAAPRVYEGGGIDLPQPDAMQPGLTLLTSVWEQFDWTPGLMLVDEKGQVVHAWRIPPGEIFADSVYRRGEDITEQAIHGTYLYPNGDVLVNIEYAGTVKLDACSRVQWRLFAGSHHAIAPDDDGGFWIPGITHRRSPRSSEYPEGYPGFEASFYHDVLIHLTEDVDVDRTISIMDVLYNSGLNRYLAKYQQLNEPDPVHLNGVAPLPDSLAAEYPHFDAGDLLLSLRNLHLIFVMDPRTGRVKWHASEPLVWQHDPKWIGDGWIAVFNNNWDFTRRGDMLGGSTILALDTESDSTRMLFPTEKSDPFYTGIKGKWQRLANGNMLLTEARAGRAVEVAPDGSSVWQWLHGPYDDEERVPELSRAQRVDLTRADLDDWPCYQRGATTIRGGR